MKFIILSLLIASVSANCVWDADAGACYHFGYCGASMEDLGACCASSGDDIGNCDTATCSTEVQNFVTVSSMCLTGGTDEDSCNGVDTSDVQCEAMDCDASFPMPDCAANLDPPSSCTDIAAYDAACSPSELEQIGQNLGCRMMSGDLEAINIMTLINTCEDDGDDCDASFPMPACADNLDPPSSCADFAAYEAACSSSELDQIGQNLGCYVANGDQDAVATLALIDSCENIEDLCGESCNDDDPQPTDCDSLQEYLNGCASDCTEDNVNTIATAGLLSFDVADCSLTYGGDGATLGGMLIVTAAAMLSCLM